MDPTPRSPLPIARIGHRLRPGRRWLPVVLAILLIGTATKGVRLAARGQALLADVRALETLAETDSGLETLASAGPLLAQTRADAAALHREASPFIPWTRYLGWVPAFGPDLESAGPLLDAALGLTAAADELYTLLSPLLSERQSGSAIGEALVDRLVAEHDRVETARRNVAGAVAAWEQIEVGSLSPRLRQRLTRVDAYLPLLRDGVEILAAVPDLAGADGPRTYLLMAQNQDELRATGGFITGAGTLTVEGGRLTGFDLADSYSVDDLGRSPLPSPPEPLARYMAAPIWVFRDSNWSPDFPSSARIGMQLYTLGTGRDLDGVVAFDQAAIRMLLGAIGPVTVEGSPEPVSADNVIGYMRDAWSGAPGEGVTPEWEAERKDFMARLGKAILSRLEADPAGLDLAAAARAVRRMFDERHLQVYLEGPGAGRVLAERGWDGAIRPGGGDFLMVVDSNLGFNKVNPNIREAVTYAVDLSDPAASVASVTVRHTHRVAAPGECRHAPDFGGGVYENLMARCYWDYLRVLVPGASELVESRVAPVPAEWTLLGVADEGAVTFGGSEAGTSFIGAFLVVPLGGERETYFRYRLPPEVLAADRAGWRYGLTLQKQAGTEAVPVSVRLTLPPGAVVTRASPEASARTGDRLDFEIDLLQDTRIEVDFREP